MLSVYDWEMSADTSEAKTSGFIRVSPENMLLTLYVFA